MNNGFQAGKGMDGECGREKGEKSAERFLLVSKDPIE